MTVGTRWLLVLMILGGGCRRERGEERLVRVWSHQGQEAENRATREIAAAFNAEQARRGSGVRVELTFFPDFQYAEKLAIAAAARDLPDAFDLDGPMVARWADAGLLARLDARVSAEERADFLPTILEQGTVNGGLYALGAFDSAAVLYFDREMLARAGVKIAETREGDGGGGSWTWTEFLNACERLKAAGIEPVAMHMDESADEWFTYAFAPVVWSGGGALIDADAGRVRGVLASEANVRSLRAWQVLFTRGFAATDPVNPDPFGSGAVAMDWSGHWMARSHLKRKGARLGAMRLPRAGGRPVAPSGSWCWGLSATAHNQEGGVAWIKWVTATETGVVPIVRANGAVPGRRSAFTAFPEYAVAPYRLFRDQLEDGSARARPRTPVYATLTSRFAAALRDIARGAEVRARLKQAEDEVARVVERRAARDGVNGGSQAVRGGGRSRETREIEEGGGGVMPTEAGR